MRYGFFGTFFAIGLTLLTTYATIALVMKFGFLTTQRKKAVKTLADYKQEILVKQGREQFKKLLEKGISIPVVFL